MYAAQLVETGTADQMVFDPLHPYSKGLMGSILVPEDGTRDVKLVAIPGTPPNLKKPPEGCRFAERCKYATAVCKASNVAFHGFDNNRKCRCHLTENELREAYANE